ncbi:uncharacterized protein LOC134185451 [Corticium candelabrum]|uniref:uncharacterized protein LOC134185451 n=1 Tax=Corticium candelabrum TaxID=121492 RepID=UPI002E27450E|nr:uncharacterized protein LOC134185451 [Corticium candelabrum]
MSLTESDAFEILELSPDASKEDIRSAYKRLALLWHPDKHNEDREIATKKFQEISAAYKRLTQPESAGIEVREMSMEEMFELFSQIFCRQVPRTFFARPNPRRRGPYYGYGFDSEDDDEDDDDDASDDGEDTIPASFVGYMDYKKKKRQQREAKYGHKPVGPVSQKQIDDAEKLASELLMQEENEKQKAEKKKAKNRKKKEAMRKRKKEKADQEKGTKGSDVKVVEKQASVELTGELVNGEKGSDDSGADEISVWDTMSAFVDRVAQKTGVHTNIPDTDVTAHVEMPKPREHVPVGVKPAQPKQDVASSTPAAGLSPENESVTPIVLKSQQVASRGNDLAQLGHFNAAVDLFTEAIRLYKDDHRYYANRSYCYDHLELYSKALKDAATCITLSPNWPKGYFRKGRALVGLKQFSDAETTFEQVLILDKQCVDAENELENIRIQQLVDMGFSKKQSEVAIKKHGQVQVALESILSGQLDEDYSNDSSPQTNGSSLNAQTAQPCTVWIGNLNTNKVTNDEVSRVFSQCGIVLGVRILSERRCAFVTFETPEMAAIAIRNLNGYFLGGKRLVLRYPDNPNRRHVLEKRQQ